jgi:CHAD domain-containing protein
MGHRRQHRPGGDEGPVAAADAQAADAEAALAADGEACEAALADTEACAAALADARPVPGRRAGAVLVGALEREAQRFLERADALGGGSAGSPTARDVHQARVALRRLRSNLRTFGLLVDPQWSAAVRADAAWFGGVLGDVRSLDVLADRLWAEGPVLVDEDSVRAVLGVLGDEAARARRTLAEASRSERGERLAAALRLVADPPLTARADQPAEALGGLLGRAWHDFRNAGRAVRRHRTQRSLHQLRLRTKAFRYGCETVAVVAGKPAERTARAAARLQDRLGLLRDAAAAEAWLATIAAAHPELAATTERLAVVERAAAAVDRRGVGRDLREVERRWHRWRD